MSIVVWIAILLVSLVCYWDQLGFIRKINSLERRLEELESDIQELAAPL